MNMYRRLSPPDYVIYGLLALGIFARLFTRPGPMLIPILVFGIIFLLYKYPPGRFQKNGKTTAYRGKSSQRRRQDERERRKSSFHVIYGKKNDSDDEPPKYH
jgi:hypothetical protein